jgi:hypothetical protein
MQAIRPGICSPKATFAGKGKYMKKILIAMLIALSMLSACIAVPAGPRGQGRNGGVMIVPFLPSIVELGVEPYYFYDNYHYHYTNDRWFYSKSRGGPWADLPRDHYPKEVRFKGKERHQDRGRDYDRRNDDRDRDNRDYDYRR